VADLAPDFYRFTESGETATFSLDNVGTEPFEVGPIVVPPGLFELGDNDCASADSANGLHTVLPGQSCEFKIDFSGVDPGVDQGEIAELVELHLSPEDRVKGDRAVLLVFGPTPTSSG
jgi:hypothetical protein